MRAKATLRRAQGRNTKMPAKNLRYHLLKPTAKGSAVQPEVWNSQTYGHNKARAEFGTNLTPASAWLDGITGNQAQYIKSMLDKLPASDDHAEAFNVAGLILPETGVVVHRQNLTKTQASKAIEELKGVDTRKLAAMARSLRVPVTVGVYHLDTKELSAVSSVSRYLQVYRRRLRSRRDVNGNPLDVVRGRLYEINNINGTHSGTITNFAAYRAKEILQQATEQPKRLDNLQLGKLGKLIGRCMICNKPLSDPQSIKRGIGPVCERRYSKNEVVEI